MTKKRLSAPPHLAPATAEWFCTVLQEYQLEGHHVRLLTLAAEAWDRGQQARAAIAEHGLTYLDKYDAPHSRPEVNIERDARTGFARLIWELDLDTEPPSEARRAPGLRSNRRP